MNVIACAVVDPQYDTGPKGDCLASRARGLLGKVEEDAHLTEGVLRSRDLDAKEMGEGFDM